MRTMGRWLTPLVALVLSACSGSAHSPTLASDPRGFFDRQAAKCGAENTTLGRSGCAASLRDQIDDEIGRTMKTLSQMSADADAAQLAWISYRTSECELESQ